MKKYALIVTAFIVLILGSSPLYSQTKQKKGIVSAYAKSYASLLFAEGFIMGLSHIAACPNIYGDKIIGGAFTATTPVWLYFSGKFLFDKKIKETYSTCERISNIAALWILSYGNYRVFNYNYFKANGDHYNTRFKRNFYEINAAILVGIIPGVLGHMSCFKDIKSSSMNNFLPKVFVSNDRINLIWKL